MDTLQYIKEAHIILWMRIFISLCFGYIYNEFNSTKKNYTYLTDNICSAK
jgi:hypothetical protein